MAIKYTCDVCEKDAHASPNGLPQWQKPYPWVEAFKSNNVGWIFCSWGCFKSMGEEFEKDCIRINQ